MKNSQKGFIAPLLIMIIILLVIGGGVYIYSSKKSQITSVEQDSVLSNTIFRSVSLSDGKLVTLQGYVYSGDIQSELMRGNQYLNLRDNSDIKDLKIISMKIMSDSLRKLLIDKYNNGHTNWVEVVVSGTIHSISLPMNGTVGRGMIIEVDTLKVE